VKSAAQGDEEMKEVADSFAQLAAIVMILITIALSTAAVAQWSAVESADEGAAQAVPTTVARAE
jgi:uncharacterized membrane protein YidH (DUF202 family)